MPDPRREWSEAFLESGVRSDESASRKDPGTVLPDWLASPALEGKASDPIRYLADNSRSFRFACRFLPALEARRIAEVYAFCRFTDDLVDLADPGMASGLDERLDAWETLAERAHAGSLTGFPLLDLPIGRMGRDGIPFRYVRELIAGMRMDLVPRTYATLTELETYTYRVAGAIGQWLTERVGIRDAWVLARAADLGHAMQLTNILRDVGEDLSRGRLYLPLDAMARHGLHPSDLDEASRWKGAPPQAYRDLMEEMMGIAERYYQRAFQGVPALPVFFQRPVFVAALVYRGIHEALRRNGYDNITRRACSTAWDKAAIGLRAYWLLPSLRALFSPSPRASVTRPHGSRDGARAWPWSGSAGAYAAGSATGP
ncbi:MAG: Squalene/phytoene synthase [Fibrobacteres bacterium]|nr:Squalene/phytoene synthase [Fibrobacterota bacterium]